MYVTNVCLKCIYIIIHIQKFVHKVKTLIISTNIYTKKNLIQSTGT